MKNFFFKKSRGGNDISLMIPVVCYCGKPLGHLEEKWKTLLCVMTEEEALNELKLKKLCCRTRMLTKIDEIQQIHDYEHANQTEDPNDLSKEYVKVHTRKNAIDKTKRRKILAR